MHRVPEISYRILDSIEEATEEEEARLLAAESRPEDVEVVMLFFYSNRLTERA